MVTSPDYFLLMQFQVVRLKAAGNRQTRGKSNPLKSKPAILENAKLVTFQFHLENWFYTSRNCCRWLIFRNKQARICLDVLLNNLNNVSPEKQDKVANIA